MSQLLGTCHNQLSIGTTLPLPLLGIVCTCFAVRHTAATQPRLLSTVLSAMCGLLRDGGGCVLVLQLCAFCLTRNDRMSNPNIPHSSH
jgi:hypothetical protein